MINQIIIIGGGKSISEGISLGLKEKIKDRCIFLTNYSYKHFNGTILCFSDKNFYVPDYAKNYVNNEVTRHPDIYDELKDIPLIIGLQKNNGIEEFLLPNTYLIPSPIKELKNTFLTGIFALCVAYKLNPKQIFLLGFDWSRQPIPENKTKYNSYNGGDIHYYKKEIQHKGSGYTGFYDCHDPNIYFKFFNNPDIKIHNVSPNTNIENFKKISYKHMFTLLNKETFNQEKLRKLIKERINDK